MNTSIIITKKIKVTAEDLSDIISAGIDCGGISYWCPKVTTDVDKKIGHQTIGEYLLNGGRLVFWEDVEEVNDPSTWTPHVVNLDDILKGIKNYVEGNYAYSTDIISSDRDDGWCIDTGMVDVEVSDCIIQFACLGDLIYG